MQIIHIGAGSVEQPSEDAVGGKAANLARMVALGLPVPPAFVLPVSLCGAVVAGDAGAREEVANGLRDGIAFLESATGRQFGARRDPLLVSVRSGAARSMPGMLDTVLNVGCTLDAVHGLMRMSGHPRFAWDCRRRFLESYGRVVLGLDAEPFANGLAELIADEKAGSEHALDADALERLAARNLDIVEDEHAVVPDSAKAQLEAAAHAVYRSWMSARACTYRRLQHLDHLAGTAVTVQAMIYGNRNRRSGAGVAFSRDPSTGEARPVIDVLFAAQGEDVVSGDRTPETEEAIAHSLPGVAGELLDILRRLERHFADVQDVEFTIEDGKLWILQTRAAKRTPLAALRFAVDFVRGGLIGPDEGLRRLEGIDLDTVTRKRLVPTQEPIARGIGASAGVAAGRAVFEAGSAASLARRGDPVILLRPDTSTSDVAGFAAAAGIVTAVGGRTAHAALVARQMGKPCIVGCAALADVTAHRANLAGREINEGDWLSLDGEAGTIYSGRCEVGVERADAEVAEVERWRAKVA